jgi:PAS domain S-box-containing protein
VTPDDHSRAELLRELDEWRARAEAAEEVLRAVQAGEVDALVVHGPAGGRVFTLQGAEEPYRYAIEQLHEGVGTLTNDGVVLYCNRTFAALVGARPGTVVGTKFSTLVAPAYAPSWSGLLKQAAAGQHCAAEIVVVADDATGLPLRLALSPMPQSGPISGEDIPQDEPTAPADLGPATICVVATDMKEILTGEHALRQAAELQRLNSELEERVMSRTRQLDATNQELEAFAYSVSHDLRAPLRHISGFAGILAEEYGETMDAEGRRALATITEAVRQMGVLIDDLLHFSRTGRAEMHIADVDMDAALREALHFLQTETEGRDIEWSLAPLPHVVGDRTLLRQVLINLLDNAVKYSRDSSPACVAVGTVDDTPASGDEPAAEAVFYVRDNGVGFDMEYAHKIFGVFQRLHDAAEFEGTGVGLANVQRIVKRLGGRVWVEAGLGEGATFFFSLPRFREDR